MEQNAGQLERVRGGTDSLENRDEDVEKNTRSTIERHSK